MKYRYVLIVFVWVILIVVRWFGKTRQVVYKQGMQLQMTALLVQEPYHNQSKQIIKLNGFMVEMPPFPSYEAGQTLRISGTVSQRVRGRLNRELMLINPEISVVQNEEADGMFRILTGIGRLRRFLLEIYGKALPEPQASLVAGISFGFRTSMPRDFYDQLQRTGTVHVVAASGQNVVILTGLLMIVLVPALGRRRAIPGVILAIVFYMVLSGMQAPIVRAAIMGSLSFLAVGLGRQQDGLVALAIAVGLMLLWQPEWGGDVGWQLSVAATAGILVIYPRLERLVEAWPEKLKFWTQGLMVTVAAQLATLPIVVINFGQLSLVAPVVNMLIAPLVPVIMVGGGILAVAGAAGDWLTRMLALLVWVPVTVFVGVVEIFGRLPGAAVEVGQLPWWWAVGYYALLASILARKKL